MNAISEGDVQFNINSHICIDCGACADVCPATHPAKLNLINTPKKDEGKGAIAQSDTAYICC